MRSHNRLAQHLLRQNEVAHCDLSIRSNPVKSLLYLIPFITLPVTSGFMPRAGIHLCQ